MKSGWPEFPGRRIWEWTDPRRALERARVLVQGVSVAEVTDRVAMLRGRETALEVLKPLDLEGFSQKRWTYRDLADFVSRASAVLELYAGVQRGDRVALCTSNTLDQPLFSLAAMRSGAVAVPLNHQLSVGEIRYILEDCGASVLVVDPRIWSEVVEPGLASGALGEGLECVLVTGQCEEPAHLLARRVWPLMGGVGGGAPASRMGRDETCAIFYTSGTTGFPKGAMLTSDGLLRTHGFFLGVPGGGPRCVLSALPMAHIMGFSFFLGAVCGGARLVYMERFRAAAVLDVLEQGGVDLFIGVPSMYQMMEEAGAGGRDLSGVRVFVSSADVMPGALMKRFKAAGELVGRGRRRVPALFVEVYGSVELAGAAMVRVSLPWQDPSGGGFVGWPLPGVSVEIRDEAGRVCERGEVGEMWITSRGVLKGYLGREEATRSAVQNGWLRTGDLATRLAGRAVRFVGREKNVIKCGGYSVFPAEIETRLLEHPDVRKAAVVGVDHATKNKAPLAVVVLEEGAKATEEEVLAWIRAEVAKYKRPERVVAILAEEMPYGSTGKILKRELRERWSDILIRGRQK